MATDPKHNMIAKWAMDELANGLASALDKMAGARPDVSAELLATDRPDLPESSLRWKLSLSGLPGEFYVTATEGNALVSGQHVTPAAGIEDASPEDLKSTFREILDHAFSIFTREAASRLQREITPRAAREVEAIPPDLAWGVINLTVGEQPVALFLGFSPQLIESLAVEPKAVASLPPTVSPSKNPPVSRTPADDSKTFDLLLDVELPVSVSFGHAHVALKDVLKLTTGSIVELTRAVIEPVDIVVNNCVIAKGEVVVVEGNFGVRIQQVISRSERLRSLQ